MSARCGGARWSDSAARRQRATVAGRKARGAEIAPGAGRVVSDEGRAACERHGTAWLAAGSARRTPRACTSMRPLFRGGHAGMALRTGTVTRTSRLQATVFLRFGG